MVVAFYFRLHLAYLPRPVVAIFARPEQRFPSTVRTLPDAACARRGARICFSWHCFFLLHLL